MGKKIRKMPTANVAGLLFLVESSSNLVLRVTSHSSQVFGSLHLPIFDSVLRSVGVVAGVTNSLSSGAVRVNSNHTPTAANKTNASVGRRLFIAAKLPELMAALLVALL